MKKKLLVFGASALLLLGAATGTAFAKQHGKSQVNALEVSGDGYTLISTAAEFKDVFNGSAGYTDKDIRLMNDIDLSELNTDDSPLYSWSGHGMAGSFGKTFDGNGKTIYGFSMGADCDLFNEVNQNAVIKDLTLIGTARGSVYSPVSYWSFGTYQNVASVIHIGGDYNTMSGFARVVNSADKTKAATFKGCSTHYIFDADQGNTFRALYNEHQGGAVDPTITDCTYTVSNLPQSYTQEARAGKVTGQGATYSDVACGLDFIKDITVVKNTNETVKAYTFGTTYTSITAVSDNTSVATVTNEGTALTINGLATGNANITVTLTSSAGIFTRTFKVTVEGAADVTEIAIDKTEATLYKTQTTKLKASIVEGNEYESISWSSNNEAVATVAGDGFNATVTAVAVGSATITVTLTTNSDTLTKTCAITVAESEYMKVYFAVKKGFTNLGENYSLFAHGGYVTTNTHFNLEDTGYEFTYGVDYKVAEVNTHSDYECELYSTNIDVSAIGVDAPGEFLFVQLRNRGDGAWGATGQLYYNDLAAGYVLSLGTTWEGGSPVVNLGKASDMDVVLDFCVDVMKSETIPLDNEGTTADCEANYNNAMTEVAKLTDAQRLLFKGTQYYERLQKWAIANGTTFSINDQGQIGSSNQLTVSSVNKNNTAIIIVVAAVLGVSLCGAALLIRRKKEQ